MQPNRVGDEERWLWPRIAKAGSDECWLWGGAVNKNGYGVVKVEGRQQTVSRYVYRITVGEPEADVLHRCGTRTCANPAHLYDGDDKQNAADRERHGRTAHNHGEAGGQARLTTEQVKAIRGDTRHAREVAADYGIHLRHVYRIRSGERRSVS